MSNIKWYSIAILIAVLSLFLNDEVYSHGMLLDPVIRSSRWRIDSTAPRNNNDDSLLCGGSRTMRQQQVDKCEMCGDDYNMPTPRPNKLGGTYGQGVITKHYVNEIQVTLGIRLAVNHFGYFYFNICNLDEFGGESEDCFNKYRINLTDGSNKLYIGSEKGWVNATIVFPKGLNCKHCVLRWNYQGGNNCEHFNACEEPENYKGCSDISITEPVSPAVTTAPVEFYDSI